MPTRASQLGLDYSPLQASVTAIIVSYHTPREDLDLCLRSAAAQCSEVILVDNGNAPDDTAWINAQEYCKLIRPPGNVGFARGCNLGAAAATSDYLLFLNPDAALTYRCVEHLLNATRGETVPTIYGAKITDEAAVEQRGSRRRTLTPWTFFSGINLHDRPHSQTQGKVRAVSGSAMFMSRVTFDALDGFDERYFLHVEDLDICRRVHDLGGRVCHVPDADVLHVGGTSGVADWVVETHKLMGFKTYMLTHHPVAGRLLWPAMSLALRARSRRS